MISTPNLMGEKVSGILLNKKSLYSSTPHPVSEHYKLLCLNRFHGYNPHQTQSHDKPTKKRNILCKSFKVYNVIHHDRAGKLHTKIHPSHINNCVHLI